MCFLVKMLLQVQKFAEILQTKCMTLEWRIGGFFSDCLWSRTQTIFPVKHLTSISPFFSIVFCKSEMVMWESLLTKRVLLHFLGQTWATSGLGAKADEMMQLKFGTACQLHFQRNGSVANLHLRAALLPVTIKQREGSLEIGCFPLKQYAWASDSGAISAALRSRCPQSPWAVTSVCVQDLAPGQGPRWHHIQHGRGLQQVLGRWLCRDLGDFTLQPIFLCCLQDRRDSFRFLLSFCKFSFY